jgi:hypothetical protein
MYWADRPLINSPFQTLLRRQLYPGRNHPRTSVIIAWPLFRHDRLINPYIIEGLHAILKRAPVTAADSSCNRRHAGAGYSSWYVLDAVIINALPDRPSSIPGFVTQSLERLQQLPNNAEKSIIEYARGTNMAYHRGLRGL